MMSRKRIPTRLPAVDGCQGCRRIDGWCRSGKVAWSSALNAVAMSDPSRFTKAFQVASDTSIYTPLGILHIDHFDMPKVPDLLPIHVDSDESVQFVARVDPEDSRRRTSQVGDEPNLL